LAETGETLVNSTTLWPVPSRNLPLASSRYLLCFVYYLPRVRPFLSPLNDAVFLLYAQLYAQLYDWL
jgi:hypothetical protein